MPRFVNFLFRALIGVALLAVVAVVGVRVLLPAETLRDLAVRRAAAALGRDVSVGEVSVSLRGGLGVRLTDVRVGNLPGFPAGDLMTVDGVDLKLRLRPLLARRVQADRLVLERPTLILTRLDSVRTNFTFDAGGGAPDATTDGGSSDAAALELERCEARDGRLEFRDGVSGFTTVLTGLRLDWRVGDGGGGALAVDGRATGDSLVLRGPRPFALGAWTLDHEAGFTLATRRLEVAAATLETGGLTVTGTGEVIVADAGPQVRFDVSGTGLTLPALLALVPPEQAPALADVRSAGAVDAAVTVTWDGALADPLGLSGEATLHDGRLEAPDLPEPLTDAAGAAAFTLDTLDMREFTARVGGAALTFRGSLADLRTPDRAALRGVLEADVDLAAFADRLPPERKATLAGRAVGRVRLDGRLDAPRTLAAGGELTLSDVRYADAALFEPVTDLDAALSFDRRDLTISRCDVKLSPSDAALSGKVVGLVSSLTGASSQPPRLDLKLTSRLFNLDNVFPPASPGTAAARPPREIPVAREFPDVTGGGPVAIGRLIYAGTTFTDVRGTVRLADRILAVDDAEAKVFAGDVTGATSVDLHDMAAPKYRGAFAASGIQADSLLTRFTPLRGLVIGDLDFRGDFSAAGLDPAAFRKSLAMAATARLAQGRLVTTGKVRQALTALSERLDRGFDGEESLRNLAGNVRIADEKVLFDDLACAMPGLGDLKLSGGYGLAGGLELQGSLLLTEENSRKLLGAARGGLAGAVGGLLGRNEQPVRRLELPVGIGGTFAAPDLRLDVTALARTAGQDVVDGLKGKLGGMLGR